MREPVAFPRMVKTGASLVHTKEPTEPRASFFIQQDGDGVGTKEAKGTEGLFVVHLGEYAVDTPLSVRSQCHRGLKTWCKQTSHGVA